jgi:phosphoserine aminotransferase
VVASSKDKNYTYIPKGFKIPSDADYFHITTNNTIFGTEIKKDYDSPVPMVADASSDILSRPIDVSKYALIYGGAQKNVGPAGVAFGIIKNDILGKVTRAIPTMLNYKTYIENESLYNTPATGSIYGCLLMLRWLKEQGGIPAIHKKNNEKAKVLYDEIERNRLFVATVPNEEDRSIMNVTFVMAGEYKEKEADFLQYAQSLGMVGIKGHRSVGGFRASIYNPLPLESVKALVQAMKDFEAKL